MVVLCIGGETSCSGWIVLGWLLISGSTSLVLLHTGLIVSGECLTSDASMSVSVSDSDLE